MQNYKTLYERCRIIRLCTGEHRRSCNSRYDHQSFHYTEKLRNPRFAPQWPPDNRYLHYKYVYTKEATAVNIFICAISTNYFSFYQNVEHSYAMSYNTVLPRQRLSKTNSKLGPPVALRIYSTPTFSFVFQA